jgi:hypothetical protein
MENEKKDTRNNLNYEQMQWIGWNNNEEHCVGYNLFSLEGVTFKKNKMT